MFPSKSLFHARIQSMTQEVVCVSLFSAERAEYVVEPIKSIDVLKTVVGGSTFAIYTHFTPKLLHDILFRRRSRALSDAVFIFKNRQTLSKSESCHQLSMPRIWSCTVVFM